MKCKTKEYKEKTKGKMCGYLIVASGLGYTMYYKSLIPQRYFYKNGKLVLKSCSVYEFDRNK